MKYYIIAGEASGDLHASNLMAAIKENDPNASFRYFGGDLMQQQGGTLVKHYREMAFMGFVPVLLNLKTILRNMQLCKDDIQAFAPDVVILVDYPGFNFKIAKYVKHQLHIPVVYYISPKIWAWKEHRIKNIKKDVDKLLCILPFEVDYFKNKHQLSVDYVGNPSVDSVAFRPDKDETFEAFTQSNSLSHKPIIALLAGSRKQEIQNNLPVMLEAVKGLDSYQMVLAGAPGIDRSYYNQFIDGDSCKIVFGQTYRLLQQAQAALVTSGTATLETALFKVPQVVCYKTPLKPISKYVFKYFFNIKYISLVNLIADKAVVTELFTDNFSPENIRHELDKLLFDPAYRQQMLDGYDGVIRRLGSPGA
ncbi:MAG TPA: lipid-A-disaccharide synthase, partial [Porphyromonadaceae bacterium]|nr:lipid-A-disaccharide synthase [Porphyromonadaceae bacterium]